MKSNSRTLVSLGGAIIATFLTGAACAALPFKINSGHPRVYLNEARVAAIRSAAGAPVPLNGTAFPQVQGSIVLEILPRPKTGTSDFEPILDVYDPTRNHIFLRHADAETVGDDLGFQVAFDDNADNTPYVTAHQFTLTRDQWHILRISWNSIAKTATIQIDGETPINLAWRQSGRIPVEWRPDGQQFRLRGRDRLDNIRIYSSDIPGPSTKVADFGMNEGSGVIALDSVSGNKLRISTGNYWVARGNGDYAIQMGSNAGIQVVAPSLLSEAWLDQRNSALVVANTLNGGGEPLSPKTVSNAHPDAITEVAKSLGLAWLVSGNPQFRAAGRVYADRLIDAPRNAGGEYAAAGRIEAMGLLYDWFFDSMGTDLRADSQSYRRALSAAILDTIKLPDLAAMICGGSRITLDPVWKCRSNDGSVAIVGPARGALGGHSREDNTKISAALFAIFDEHPEIANLLAIEHRNFTNLYHPMRAWVGENGGSHMGWDYAATYNDLFAVLLWEKGSSVSLRAPWQGNLIDRDIYGLRGDFTFPASGDTFGYRLGHALEKSFALWGGAKFGNGYGVNFYNNWVLPYGDSIGYWSRINELLFWEPGLSDVSIGNLDYSRWFRNAGQVLMRDTWNFPAATLLEFKSTSFSSENHHHLDQNAFTVFYRAPLLVDSGYYDSYGTPHWYNYFTRSIAHNTITIWDPSESFYHYGNGNTYSNDGGQRYMQKTYPTLAEIQEGGPNHLDGITAYEYSSNYTYTVGNASKAYQSKKLDHDAGFVRSLLYLRAPSFWNKPVTVVFDKVTASAAGAGLTKRFLLHTVNEPVPPGGSAVGPGIHKLPGSTIEVRNGEGLLFSQTLLPEKAVITKIGGKDATNDFRFLVPSRTATDYQVGFVNYPPRPDPGASLTDTLVAPDMGAWRIEVSAPGATRREYFLHVLSVADDGAVAGPPEAQNLSSVSAAVALLARSQLVAFNKSDQVDAPLNWNMPVISDSMIVAGLQPNATYAGRIRGNGPFVVNFLPDPNGQLVASAQGVIAVAATSLERVGADNNSP